MSERQGGQSAEKDAGCNPACSLGTEDHPGWNGYRCMDADGNTLPFPGEPYPYAIDECPHEQVRQISEHDVECIDCGLAGS